MIFKGLKRISISNKSSTIYMLLLFNGTNIEKFGRFVDFIQEEVKLELVISVISRVTFKIRNKMTSNHSILIPTENGDKYDGQHRVYVTSLCCGGQCCHRFER